MTKTQDRYLLVHPWKVVEEGFHPERTRVSESLFSLSNGYLGMRGALEEGYSGSSLPGFYVNGVLEEHALQEPPGYRGIPRVIRFMVNTVDWLSTRISCDGEPLDLGRARHTGFVRELDMRSGLLSRSFTWTTASGRRVKVTLRRLLSMRTAGLCLQDVSFSPLNFSGTVEVTLGLDFSLPHEAYKQNLWDCERAENQGETCALLGRGAVLQHLLFAACRVSAPASCPQELITEKKRVARLLRLAVEEGVEARVQRASFLANFAPATDPDRAWTDGARAAGVLAAADLEEELRSNREHWAAVWKAADIEIYGDDAAQQGIRYSIFQLQQTCREGVPGAHVGAKGYTGEAYNGHTFWDTEIYCLPHYLFTVPAAARALLDFRWDTLPRAMERARELDCRGACYPVATIDGTESCTLWQHANLQFQATTGVAYAIRHYVSITGDRAYLADRGMEMLVQICRFLASRGQWSSRGHRFGFYGVMGPDEFHLMVNNNAYTNVMARETFRFTLDSVRGWEKESPGEAAALLSRLECTREERARWTDMADAMIVLVDEATGIVEQQEGYFGLPHIDVDAIGPEEFPLYSHWSYDRIYRSDMIKQPDVLMLPLLFSADWTREQKQVNYQYYEPRCIHESSLSPSVHSILAAELGLLEQAVDLFRFATRVDLDNYNRTTAEGLHMTSLAAAWMNIVYGFGGMRSDARCLSFSPTLPTCWKGYSFPVAYRGSVIRVEVDRTRARFQLASGPAVAVSIRGARHCVTARGVEVPVS